MTERIMFGNNGSQFVARVARPTKDVSSTNLSDFVMHESFNTLVPIARGTVTLAANASTSFTLPETVGKHPFVVLKSVEGILPLSDFNSNGYIFPGTYSLRVNPSNGFCQLFNKHTTSLTITYAVFISP